jgi:hypothetical protein
LSSDITVREGLHSTKNNNVYWSTSTNMLISARRGETPFNGKPWTVRSGRNDEA